MHLATISIGIDPTVQLGPLTLTWHGLSIALGILVGGLVAAREVRRRGLDPEPLYTVGVIVVVGALVGGRVYYLMEHGQLFEPSEWLSTRGFTFYGGFIAAALGIAVFIWRRGLSVSYLDAMAVGLPVGRRGDSPSSSSARTRRRSRLA
jgi:phosphatidylglycerol:prolipoprotein diacylglycerol transferase